MTKFTIYLLNLIILLVFVSCTSGPSPIVFGEDECSECKMKISDHRFGAEVITQKGKIKKFDSVECLVDYLNNNQQQEIAGSYVIDFLNPKVLLDANTSGYLISKKIPSPMGGFISSYTNSDIAKTQQNKSGGQVYSWTNLKNYLNK